MKIKALIIMTLVCNLAYATDDLSSQAYCDYNKNKATAERIFDQAPNITAGFGRASTATGNVFIIGLNESLSKFLQGTLSHKIGDADCHLYQVTTEIQKHVTFDQQSIARQQAEHRLDMTEAAIASLQQYIDDENTRVNAGTGTLQNVATLQAAKQSLVISSANLKQQIALITIPEIDDERLDHLIKMASVYTLEVQEATAKQQKYQNWDIAVTVGEGTNPREALLHSLPNEAFATAQFTYNLGASARNRALDKAATRYTDAIVSSQTGPIHLGQILQTEVTKARDQSIVATTAFESYESSIDQQLKSINGLDTMVARSFRIQLAISSINNNIELESTRLNRSIMTKYLAQNFGAQE